ncbi:glycoside hydrolase N-terminal domain-containing protein [Pedobacter sp. PLR]|uniref:glycoside hydrolase family 95 protein n=1 Tax=Pedobacter sp. PLR TaxID=2994465 RepID=UPI0022472ABB|nr:glycoside hydrolase N-terminal domain-containing protein [Pedobacter sp. PLR]MCX2452506.1 glycoside hydrolase N-terminal domain-containing protein [Pedobacter sp. PLR]
MNITIFKISLVFVNLLAFSAGFAQQAERPESAEELPIAKPSAAQLWYTKPAEKWTDALPIGNGRIGAMIFAGVAQERIQFNEETLWTGAPRDYNHAGAANYLSEIRQLLFEGKQEAAEKLAAEKFMGTQSTAGDRYKWVEEMKALKGINGNPAGFNYDDSKWKSIKVPSYEGWETVGLSGFDGAVWLRTTIDVPASWLGQNLVLDLNRIRDQDFTYINGKLAGNTDGTSPRKYTIPAKLIKKGKNVIAIQVLNYFDKGGVAGYKDTSRPIAIYPVGTGPQNGLSLVKEWKYKIQNDEPPLVSQFQASYQPFGELYLNFKNQEGSVSNYKRKLDLSTAIASTSYSVAGVNYLREYFASQPNQALVIRLTADQKNSISLAAILGSPHKYTVLREVDANTIALSLKVRDGELKGETQLKAVVTKGELLVKEGKLIISNADEVLLYLTAGTNFINDHNITADPEDACVKAFASLKHKNYNQVKAAHLKEYQKYYNTFSVSFGSSAAENLPTDERIERFPFTPDAPLAALYMQYARYLLISSSRPGTQPANLQGIWNDLLTPPWGSKYTTNINLEMNYWPTGPLNLPAMNEPLFKKTEALAKNGAVTAKVHYDARGWVLHHNTDLWNATAPINASNHGIWVAGAGWLSQHLWEHYRFTQDKDFLKNKAYPIMKEAATFFVDFLVKDPKTGWLISTPSNSPENGGLVAGPAMDHQIIRALFKNCIQAGKLLNIDAEFRDTLQNKLGLIAPDQIGKYGQLQEWLEDKDDTTNKHRHVSHLWGVYPGEEITRDRPELMNAAKQSLIYRGDEGTGWSLAWKINFWARFKDGDHAMKMVKMLISPAEKGGGAYLNLFDAHPPFQIDGNFGGAAGMAEMLLQSHTKDIELLPALPADFSTGEVKGICARGGFELSFKWSNSVLTSVEVEAKDGGPCSLRYGDKTISIATQKGKTYKFNGDLEKL